VSGPVCVNCRRPLLVPSGVKGLTAVAREACHSVAIVWGITRSRAAVVADRAAMRSRKPAA
jgi:hypothetical protein